MVSEKGDAIPYEERWVAEKASDPRTNEDLITSLLTEEDDGVRNDMLTILQARRDPMLIRRAVEMCKSTIPAERRTGVGILAQNGAGSKKILLAECVEALLERVLNDDDVEVLTDAAWALDDYEDPRIATALAQLKDHPHEDVRFGIVMGLSFREDEVSVATLIDLSKDSDEDVRNWATFYLRKMEDVDSHELREALLQRVYDENAEIRGEALLGLALRKDQRIVEPLLNELQEIAKPESENFWDHSIEAAKELADPRFYPYLVELREQGVEGCRLDEAIAACCPHSSKEDSGD